MSLLIITVCVRKQPLSIHILCRPTAIINLDPANENAPYEAAVSLQELITVEDAAEIYGLGPNGGLMYCLEFLEANLDWLEERLRSLPGHYFIFDCPGQAELYTHHESFARIVAALGKRLDLRLCAVHLVDAHYVSDPTKYIAAALMSLTAMIRLELPHINVLSKLDLVAAYGQPGELCPSYIALQRVWHASGLYRQRGKLHKASVCCI